MFGSDEINGESFILNLSKSLGKSCELKADSLKELEKWKADTKASVLSLIGTDRLKRSSEKPKLIESKKMTGYRRNKYILPTAENLKMPLYVLIPDECNGKVMLALHGHGCYGKEGIVGNIPKEIEVSLLKSTAFALELVQRGYIVVCPDLLGSGERITGFSEDKSKSVCDLLNNALIAMGLSLQGVTVFELMCLTDFMLEFKENKYDKVGVLGFSGGGLFSLLLTALCDKVDTAVVSGYFHTQRDTVLQSNKCGCNFVPRMWSTADCGELAALASPKPLYIECGSEDKLHGRSGTESIYKQLDIAKKAYSIYNQEDNLQLVLCEGAHQWYGSCYEFLKNKAL